MYIKGFYISYLKVDDYVEGEGMKMETRAEWEKHPWKKVIIVYHELRYMIDSGFLPDA